MTIHIHPTAMTPAIITQLQHATGGTVVVSGNRCTLQRCAHTPKKAAPVQAPLNPFGGDAA